MTPKTTRKEETLSLTFPEDEYIVIQAGAKMLGITEEEYVRRSIIHEVARKENEPDGEINKHDLDSALITDSLRPEDYDAFMQRLEPLRGKSDAIDAIIRVLNREDATMGDLTRLLDALMYLDGVEEKKK